MAIDDRQGLDISFDEDPPTSGARIKVVGVGGGGGNAVNHMIDARIEGIDFLVANTDAQALKRAHAPIKLQIGSRLTKGLGAGANPEIGRDAALEDTDKILEALEGADMVFVTVGMGGGTGTGAAPIIASLAAELGALTVAVVTKPFPFEGRRRMQQADLGLQELRSVVDRLITIPNERLKQTVDRNMTLSDSFRMADDVLRQAVQGISDLITVPGFINVDFADVKSIMKGMGIALMGTGHALGDNRAQEATQRAIEPNRDAHRRKAGRAHPGIDLPRAAPLLGPPQVQRAAPARGAPPGRGVVGQHPRRLGGGDRVLPQGADGAQAQGDDGDGELVRVALPLRAEHPRAVHQQQGPCAVADQARSAAHLEPRGGAGALGPGDDVL